MTNSPVPATTVDPAADRAAARRIAGLSAPGFAWGCLVGYIEAFSIMGPGAPHGRSLIFGFVASTLMIPVAICGGIALHSLVRGVRSRRVSWRRAAWLALLLLPSLGALGFFVWIPAALLWEGLALLR
jgi:hypothetical protein